MTSQRALLRADASVRVGTGHVQRCLTLAGALRSRGWTTVLAGRYPGELAALAVRSGHQAIEIPEGLAGEAEPGWLRSRHLLDDVSLLVTDGYELTATWHRAVGRPRPVMLAIDDLAREPLEVDIVLNQNLGADADRYRGLIPARATVLAGPRYSLVRPEFPAARHGLAPRSGQVTRILVFLSGADEHDVTRRAAAAALVAGVPVDIVVGAAYPFLPGLRAWAADHPLIEIHSNTTRMAHLMAAADLAIGAPSSTSWERCTLGLPAVLLTLADNQVEVAGMLADAGAAVSLGWHTEVTVERLEAAVADLLHDPERVRAMSHAAAGITDGLGADRVATALETLVDTRNPRNLQKEHSLD